MQVLERALAIAKSMTAAKSNSMETTVQNEDISLLEYALRLAKESRIVSCDSNSTVLSSNSSSECSTESTNCSYDLPVGLSTNCKLFNKEMSTQTDNYGCTCMNTSDSSDDAKMP